MITSFSISYPQNLPRHLFHYLQDLAAIQTAKEQQQTLRFALKKEPGDFFHFFKAAVQDIEWAYRHTFLLKKFYKDLTFEIENETLPIDCARQIQSLIEQNQLFQTIHHDLFIKDAFSSGALLASKLTLMTKADYFVSFFKGGFKETGQNTFCIQELAHELNFFQFKILYDYLETNNPRCLKPHKNKVLFALLQQCELWGLETCKNEIQKILCQRVKKTHEAELLLSWTELYRLKNLRLHCQEILCRDLQLQPIENGMLCARLLTKVSKRIFPILEEYKHEIQYFSLRDELLKSDRLVLSLAQISSLHTLNLNMAPSFVPRYIQKALSQLPNVTTLKIHQVKSLTTSCESKSFVEGDVTLDHISKLQINSCHSTNLLCHLLHLTPHLQELHLQKCHLSDISFLLPFTSKRYPLKTFFLDQGHLKSKHLRIIADTFPFLEKLHLHTQERLHAADLIYLLRACPNLTHLNVHRCQLSERFFSTFSRDCSRLLHLHLLANELKEQDLEDLLLSARHLQTLNLRRCSPLLLTMLQRYPLPELQTLYLSPYCIDKELLTEDGNLFQFLADEKEFPRLKTLIIQGFIPPLALEKLQQLAYLRPSLNLKFNAKLG